MSLIKPLSLKDIEIQDAFWNRYIRLVREKVIPYQWETLNDRVPDAARSHFMGSFKNDYAGMFAATCLSFLPGVIVYLIGQKYFVEGIVMTGMKN